MAPGMGTHDVNSLNSSDREVNSKGTKLQRQEIALNGFLIDNLTRYWLTVELKRSLPKSVQSKNSPIYCELP